MADKIDVDRETAPAIDEKATEGRSAEPEETGEFGEMLEKARPTMRKVVKALSRANPDANIDAIVESVIRQMRYEELKKK